MNWSRTGKWILGWGLAFCVMAPAGARAEPARVAVAISLKDAMTEAAEAYRAEGRGDVEFTFGASGRLQAQIEYGAEVDAFVSAAHQQVDELVKDGHADGATKRVVAGNRLVLVVPAGAKAAPTFKNLADARVRRVAIGEPKTVPAGRYAMQALKALDLADALTDRLVYGANVRQVLDYVERGEVDAGIVYATDALESGVRVRVIESPDPKTHDAIEYPAVIVRNSRRRKAAGEFLDYLTSDKAREIFDLRGFTTHASGRPRE